MTKTGRRLDFKLESSTGTASKPKAKFELPCLIKRSDEPHKNGAAGEADGEMGSIEANKLQSLQKGNKIRLRRQVGLTA